jgi:branched-chain amino acid transport system substrate-binding protein
MYVNNDFGKGGRDMITKALEGTATKIVADISTDAGQVDFSPPVLKAKQSNADAVFVYTNEEESARALRELRKQGWTKPIIGETTLTGQKVIELAGDAANGALAHVGLTVDAPKTRDLRFGAKFQQEYKSSPTTTASRATPVCTCSRPRSRRPASSTARRWPAAMKGLKLQRQATPGVLMDVSFDDKGDLDRESFLVEVKDGRRSWSSAACAVQEISPARRAGSGRWPARPCSEPRPSRPGPPPTGTP